MEYITSKIYNGKAGAFDGITDILLNTVNKPVTTRELDTYMTERLHRRQTGFVPYMEITVDQMRLVQRVKQIIKTKRHCFGLFIDFLSAYDTIYHYYLTD